MSAEETHKVQTAKAEIMKAAKLLFQRYGFNKTTIEEIASNARKSKTTLYQIFSNKEEIFTEILLDEGRSLFDHVISEVSKQKNSASELKTYISTTISEAKKRLLLYSLLKGELKSILINHKQVKHDIDLFEKEVVKNIIYNGIQTGQFSNKYERYLDYIAYYVINFTRGVVLQLILDEDSNAHLKDDDIFEVLMNMMIKGLKD
jgi:AcrR family transcriptional regulator